MKYKLHSAIGLLLLSCSSLSFCGPGIVCPGTGAVEISAVDTLTVISSPDLLPLVNSWAAKFSSINPAVKISVATDAGNIGSGSEMITITSGNIPGTGTAGSSWNIVIGHNAVIPVINAANPVRDQLMAQGLSSAAFGRLLSGNQDLKWGDIIKGGGNEPVKIYYSSADAVIKSISKFAQVRPEDLTGEIVMDEDELISVISREINSIGFCRLPEIRYEDKNEMRENIALLPVDRNGNGRIDTFESIYNNLDELTRGIWIGKYPSTLCGSIVATCNEKPSGKNQKAFLSWIISDGSDYLASNGFVSLASIEREAGLSALDITPLVNDIQTATSYSWLLILASIIALIILISVIVTRSAKAGKTVPKTTPPVRSAFNESIITSPMGLLFDKSHTWTFMERDGLVRFGVDDFIQHITGTITGMRLKEPGDFVRRGEKLLSIVKDGKQIDLYSPISGKIKSLNTSLTEDPSLFNSSPYTDGWVYLIEPRNWTREMQLMFMADKYRLWLRDEFERLKSFISTIMRENSTGAYVILQDGGEMKDNLLSDLEPEIWEDFQRRFIDTSR